MVLAGVLPHTYGDGKTPAACIASVPEGLVLTVATMLEDGERPPTAGRAGERTKQVNIRLTASEKALLENHSRVGGFTSERRYWRRTDRPALGWCPGAPFRSFRPASICLTVGRLPRSVLGKDSTSLVKYRATPTGLATSRSAYSATTRLRVLQRIRPMEDLSSGWRSKSSTAQRDLLADEGEPGAKFQEELSYVAEQALFEIAFRRVGAQREEVEGVGVLHKFAGQVRLRGG